MECVYWVGIRRIDNHCGDLALSLALHRVNQNLSREGEAKRIHTIMINLCHLESHSIGQMALNRRAAPLWDLFLLYNYVGGGCLSQGEDLFQSQTPHFL